MTVTKVLVANRGEIAIRVIRACRDAGIASVACYADQDRRAPWTRLADEAVALDGSTAAATYLDIAALLRAADTYGADAVHPGYGFLSENAGFASAVLDAGLVWIGPPPEAIDLLGDKVAARRLAAGAGVPVVVGSPGPLSDAAEVAAFAREHGLPLAVKAAHGGGGRGMRVVATMEEIPAQFEAAVREAAAAFGRGECFVERYLPRARHVEAQVLADHHGQVVVVGTRDCTLQRRYQKLVEEAPAPWLTDEQRRTIQESAEAVCRAAGYRGAGTVEYLVAADGTVTFLEVNARLQVEHPVTEETTGIDLVREQLRIASGCPLSSDVRARAAAPVARHSIEFRINGEDPGRGFLPSPGTLTRVVWPAGPGVRVDAGIEAGSVVGGAFDSLLGKLVVTGADREQALQRARRALDETVVDGVATVLPFHRAVVRDPAFVGDSNGFAVHTRWMEEDFDHPFEPYGEAADGPERVTVPIGGRLLRVGVPGLADLGDDARTALTAAMRSGRRRGGAAAAAGDTVRPPMQGTVVRVAVGGGERVEAGATLVVVEAMKMEHAVVAPVAGTVTGLTAEPGQSVGPQTVLCSITAPVPDTDGPAEQGVTAAGSATDAGGGPRSTGG